MDTRIRFCNILAATMLSVAGSGFSQSSFGSYGPPGAPVFKDLSDALRNPAKVYLLDLTRPVEQQQFARIGALKALQALRLRNTGTTSWPAEIGELSNLCYLASYENPITSFPPSLNSFALLQHIEFHRVKADSIPASIAWLTRLHTLRVNNSDDTLKLAATLHYLKNLRELSLEECVCDSIMKIGIPSLKYLSLINTRTYGLSEIDKPALLEVLIIEQNPIAKLPFDIYKCRNLRVISLRNTRISKLPESIAQLENLTVLDLRGTQVSREEIENLKVLLPGCEIKH